MSRPICLGVDVSHSKLWINELSLKQLMFHCETGNGNMEGIHALPCAVLCLVKTPRRSIAVAGTIFQGNE